ncbi:MAG: hypothetical protein ACLTAF_02540 [Blautia coccoides]
MTPKPAEHEGCKHRGKDRDGTGRRNNRGQILYPRKEYHLTFLMEENGETVAVMLSLWNILTPIKQDMNSRAGPQVPESSGLGNMTYTATWKASDGIVRSEVHVEERAGYA